MQNELMKDDEELRAGFRALKSPQDIAALLEIPYKTLLYHLYRYDGPRYKKFSITKKSGGDRVIKAPISNIKILQRKLSYVLYLVYKTKPCVHGFSKEKGIVTNARAHFRKKVIVNVDIKDFFPSIHFGRVRGLFIAKPYSFPKSVATVLAQICCDEGSLPQGAPTSPIISNMICSRLDNELMRLAKKYHTDYTRYADDITFSSTNKKFVNSEFMEELDRAIVQNWFILNTSKTRICGPDSQHEVTGLIINKKINVRRKFIRQIRAMTHAIKKFGLEAAEAEHFSRYRTKQYNPNSQPKFKGIVGGKINFVKNIRGRKDRIFAKLQNQFNDAVGVAERIPTDAQEEIENAIWIIESGGEQGTGFMLKDHGLVSCNHVVKNDEIIVYKSHDVSTKYPATVLSRDEHHDLAILEIGGTTGVLPFLEKGDDSNLKKNSIITVAGFPDHFHGDECYIVDGKITRSVVRSAVTFFSFNMPLLGGMSGGPALNERNQVIGIVSQGATDPSQIDKLMFYGIMPIRHLSGQTNP